MKIKKFLAIGTLSVMSILTNAQASGIPITNEEINQVKTTFEATLNNLEESKNTTLDSSLYTVKPNIKVTLVFPETDLTGKNYDKIISFYKTNEGSQTLSSNDRMIAEGTDSYVFFREIFSERIKNIVDADVKIRPAGGELYRVNNECLVNVYVEKDGSSLRVTSGKDVLKMTELQNPEQIKMNQKILLAHESGHCEFSMIQNPIMIPGKSDKVNQELSYILRDQVHDNTMRNISYMSLLNENYADISAAYALIKEYGTDNADLNYVLNAFLIQRQDNYFNRHLDTHFTHISLHNALDTHNIQKMLTIEDPQEMQQFILSIANKGVLQLAADSREIEYEIFNKDNFSYGIIQSMANIVIEEYAAQTPRENVITMWEDSIQRGLSYEIGKNILELKKFDKSNIADYFVNTLEFVLQTDPSDFVIKNSDAKKLQKAYETIEEMRGPVLEYRQSIQSAHNLGVNFYKSHQKTMDKDEVKTQMSALRILAYVQNKSKNQPIN